MRISDGNGKRLKIWSVWLNERASQESEGEDESERLESIIDGVRSNKIMIFNFTL